MLSLHSTEFLNTGSELSKGGGVVGGDSDGISFSIAVADMNAISNS